MGFKVAVAGVVLFGVLCFNYVYNNAVQPEVASEIAMKQLANPSKATDTVQRTKVYDVIPYATLGVYGLFVLGLFWSDLRKVVYKMRHGFVCLTLVSIAFLTGCYKPYHEAMRVPVGTSEVAFLVETINDAGQVSVAPKGKGDTISEDGEITNFYKNRMVNARMVEIPYYWKQTYRYFLWEDGSTGKWEPAARLIVVDTQPETRQWSQDKKNGIWVESSDSVGFSTGISISARIENQEDAITFLSNYPPEDGREIVTAGSDPFTVEVTNLDQILDEEVKTKIQELFAFEAAAYEMDDLRSKKREIMATVESQTVEFFKNRGISITSMGQFGGFTYENPEIQKSIDKVFQAQQDKQVAIAESEAAQERKLALKLVGEGEAAKILELARGKAEGVKIEAQAEAEAIKQVADAKSYELQKLQENPEAYLQLKLLEVEVEKLHKWDGSYPNFLVSGNGEKSPLGPMILNLPQQK